MIYVNSNNVLRQWVVNSVVPRCVNLRSNWGIIFVLMEEKEIKRISLPTEKESQTSGRQEIIDKYEKNVRIVQKIQVDTMMFQIRKHLLIDCLIILREIDTFIKDRENFIDFTLKKINHHLKLLDLEDEFKEQNGLNDTQ